MDNNHSNSSTISNIVDSSNINGRIKRELSVYENRDHTEDVNVPIKREIPTILDKTSLRGSECIILSSNIYIPSTVYNRIFPHQQANIKWLADLHNNNLGGILADEMGMGKTVTIATFIYALMFSNKINPNFLCDHTLNILLVCPPTLMLQWEEELLLWAKGIKITYFDKEMNIRFLLNKKQFQCLFITYDALRIYIDVLNRIDFLYVILDEGQQIRNPDSNITQSVKTINTPHRILISGSPIQNNLIEFWSLFDFCIPGKLGILPLFIELFVEPIRAGGSINSTKSQSCIAYRRARALRELTSPFIKRHTKSECSNIKLPKKTEQVVFCHLSPLQYQLYHNVTTCPYINTVISHYAKMKLDRAEQSSRRYRSEGGFGRLLRVISLLRKICNHPDLLKGEWDTREKMDIQDDENIDTDSNSDDFDSENSPIPNDSDNVNNSNNISVNTNNNNTTSCTSITHDNELASLSGKLTVALDIIHEWSKQGHKILFFSQTIKMLNIAERCIKIPFLRIDGTVPIKKRGDIISKFNSSDIQLLLLTTRVGGVGLNLTSATRIIIFDPDWNPMVDSQASQRCYRIGQTKPVVIIRLVNAHTIEEKIYYRQIYKFHLSEKILTNPRMERPKAFNDILDLFTCPEPPPNYVNPETNYLSPELKRHLKKISNLKFKNSNLRLKRALEKFLDDEEDDLTISAILQKNKIQTVVKHDKTVEPNYDIEEDDGLDLLNSSFNFIQSENINIPTWTGKKGNAGKSFTNDFKKGLSNNELKKLLIEYFLKSPNNSATTSQILENFSHLVNENQKIQFKLLLKRKNLLMNVLVVAEKPSIAEAIANALSNHNIKPKQGKFPVWIVTTSLFGPKSTLHITSTTGHIFNLSFQNKYNNWENTDPLELFSAQVIQTYANSDAIANHLAHIAKDCDSLTLALDNDREGENICFEVISIVSKHLKSKDKGLGKNIFRARFSSLVKSDIIDAFKKLGIPNKNESDAVMARQEIDLKLGCAFTRFQTLSFQDKFGNLNTKLISYGPCQTPTLFFCVERFKQIKSFQPQTYYKIDVEINVNGERIHLIHSRGHIFNLQVTEIIKDLIKEELFVLTNVNNNVKTISRPTALNTVNLLKMTSQQLSLGPHHALSVAEKLYLSGYISYPRTETTAYPENFDTKSVFNMLKSANFPQDIFSSSKADRIKFNLNQIHRGKDAGDHPPITPVCVPNPSKLSPDELNIYMLIVRNFLASISVDCKFKEEKYTFKAASETFIYTCTKVVEPGFTLITNKSTPTESSPINVNIGDRFKLCGCYIKSAQTTPPSLLSESDLLELMEKNGIGTDASMATHINNICLRGYVKIVGNRRLEPTKLGLSLVYGYLQVDPELVLPTVRGNIESLCDSVATGKFTLQAVISHSLEIFRLKFIYFTSNIDSMVQAFMQNFTLAEDMGVLMSRCGICNRYMVYVNSAYPRLVCKHCDSVYKLPPDGTIKLFKEIKCPLDNFELVQYQVKGGKSYTLCPMCYNDPPFEDFTSKSAMNCSKCPHPTCPNGIASISVGACDCDGILYFDLINQGPKWRILCNECSVEYIIATRIKLLDSCDDCEGRILSIGDKGVEGCFACDANITSQFTKIGNSDRAVPRARGGQARRSGHARGRGRGRGRPNASFSREKLSSNATNEKSIHEKAATNEKPLTRERATNEKQLTREKAANEKDLTREAAINVGKNVFTRSNATRHKHKSNRVDPKMTFHGF